MLFVTHFDKLVDYLSTFPAVKVLTMKREEGKFQASIAKYGNATNYGIESAKSARFPLEILNESMLNLKKVILCHKNANIFIAKPV